MKRYKMLGVGKKSLGYTIVEAMIFLAVSGGLLVSVAGVINSRQEKTRFSQSIDDMSIVLQDYFNDVSTGYYPRSAEIRCQNDGSGLRITNTGAAVDTQGTNENCVFSGKFFAFTPDSTNYSAYTIVSRKDSASFIGGANELAGIGNNTGAVDNLSNKADIRITKVIEKRFSGSHLPDQYRGLIVVSDFGSQIGSSLTGNAGKLKLYLYRPSPLTEVLSTNPPQLVDFPSDSEILICLAQPEGGSRVGVLKITSQLTVERLIGDDDIC